jgi:putative YhbY family RNA-binding protein
MKRHVRHVLKDENPTIWIGKDGLTAQSVSEIEKQLQKNKMVKVRVLPAALKELTTAEDIAKKAATATESALVEVRGHVFILFRKRRTDGQLLKAPDAKAAEPEEADEADTDESDSSSP